MYVREWGDGRIYLLFAVAAVCPRGPWEKKGSFEFYFPEDETEGLWIS